MNEQFNDYKHYTQEMAKSAYDKLSFINKIYENIDLIVDFGCADGTVTRFIQLFYPGARIIGYDLPEILEKTESNHRDDTIDYISDLGVIKGIVSEYKSENKKSLLIMNSVYHEIINYMPCEDANDPLKGYTGLLDALYTMDFDYIFIRDMNITVPIAGKYVDIIPEFFVKLITKIRTSEEYASRYNDFINTYNKGKELNPLSSIDQIHIVHFLLKCRYKQNWERELPEDYTAVSSVYPKDSLYLSTAKKYPYHLADSKKYVLPYVEYINKVDFGISLRGLGITTHSYALYKRNMNKNK